MLHSSRLLSNNALLGQVGQVDWPKLVLAETLYLEDKTLDYLVVLKFQKLKKYNY